MPPDEWAQPTGPREITLFNDMYIICGGDRHDYLIVLIEK